MFARVLAIPFQLSIYITVSLSLGNYDINAKAGSETAKLINILNAIRSYQLNYTSIFVISPISTTVARNFLFSFSFSFSILLVLFRFNSVSSTNVCEEQELISDCNYGMQQ